MIWVKGWGVLWILVFWPSYYFEMKFKVSFQLPVNRFLYVEYSISERMVKFDKISILANFPYYFMYKI